MTTENKTIKSLGHYKRKMKVLNNSLKVPIQESIWPLTNFVLKQETISLIEEIQSTIAYLGSLNKSSEALRYVEYFSFSLANRLLSIERIRTRSSRNIPGIDKTIIKNVYDFKTCLSLALLTHPKHIEISSNLEVKYVEILKKDTSKLRVLGIHNIVDRVLQLQMLTFLDPLIDATLPENFYSFRKSRSSLQAIASLFKSIKLSDISKYHLVSVNIRKCFDSITHEFILDKFPFPVKYKNLLVRWIKCFRVLESGKKIKMLSGVAQGSILGPIICNFTLAHLTNDFFMDPFFSKNPVLKNLKGKIRPIQVSRFLMVYADDLMIKVINRDEADYALKKLVNKLSEAGLDINSEKTRSYDLSVKAKFDWLGYTFLALPKKSLRYTKLVNRGERFTRGVNKKYQTVLLLYITNTNFTSIKKKLKEEIKKLKHGNLFPVLRKVNYMLRGISGYYGFATVGHRFDYLQHFVDRVFWRTLVEKFRYKGIRRSGWVARTFFVTTISPLGLKWHLHSPISDANSLKKRNVHALWCVNVSTFFRLQPMSINILPKKLKTNSFYLFRKEFNSHNLRIQERRTNYNYTIVFGDLLKRQKGICLYCNKPLDLFDESSFKIHHKIPLKICITKEDQCLANRKVNICLLHQHCHKNLHSNINYAKSRGLYHNSVPKQDK